MTILICAVAAIMAGRWVFKFFRSMVRPGKGGCGCGCGCGGAEKKNTAPKTVFIPVSALTKKN